MAASSPSATKSDSSLSGTIYSVVPSLYIYFVVCGCIVFVRGVSWSMAACSPSTQSDSSSTVSESDRALSLEFNSESSTSSDLASSSLTDETNRFLESEGSSSDERASDDSDDSNGSDDDDSGDSDDSDDSGDSEELLHKQPQALESPIHSSVFEPLHDGHLSTTISVFESHLLIYQFCLKHGLSATASQELLQLLELHLPGSKIPTSPYALRRFFNSLFPDLISSVHYYCSQCHRPIDAQALSCSQRSCHDSTKESFICIPLEAQLKRKLEGIHKL